MYVCGCKVSQQAPFCDGVSCQMLVKGEAFKLEDDMLYLEEDEEI